MIRETHTLALWRSLDIASRARRIDPATIAQAERSFRKGLTAAEAATVLAVVPYDEKVHRAALISPQTISAIKSGMNWA